MTRNHAAPGTQKRVAVFTAGRADFGPLEPVIDCLRASDAIDLSVIASGTYLDSEHRVIDDLCAPDVVLFEARLQDSTSASLASALGPIGRGVVEALRAHRSEVLLVLGDRWELLAALAASLLSRVPIAHLHGGEVTLGAIDDRVRDAVTKMADLHLCATEAAATRIRAMGEAPDRVVVTGAPGLDRFRLIQLLDSPALAEQLGIDIEHPFALVTYHPPTVGASPGDGARAVFEAVAATTATAVVTYPGADPGADSVIEEIQKAASRYECFHVRPSLGPLYPHAMAHADLMVGNSSSGICEAASFHLPVVNIGTRQQGRERSGNVIDCDESVDAIRYAIRRALDPTFRSALSSLRNIYGDGYASPRVLAAILGMPGGELGPKGSETPV